MWNRLRYMNYQWGPAHRHPLVLNLAGRPVRLTARARAFRRPASTSIYAGQRITATSAFQL